MSANRFQSLCLCAIFLGSIAIVGCGNGLTGTKYEADGAAAGAASVEFKSSSKAYVTFMGTTMEADYEKDDDKVIFKNINGANVVMTIEKDGSLSGPLGLSLKKKS